MAKKRSDYNGWPNWDSWHVALLIDNTQETQARAREIIETARSQGLSLEQMGDKLRGWALPAVVGPYNALTMKDTQEWNDLTPEERHSEFPDASIDHAEDDTPILMEDHLIDWTYIARSFLDEVVENERYEEEVRRNPPPTTQQQYAHLPPDENPWHWSAGDVVQDRQGSRAQVTQAGLDPQGYGMKMVHVAPDQYYHGQDVSLHPRALVDTYGYKRIDNKPLDYDWLNEPWLDKPGDLTLPDHWGMLRTSSSSWDENNPIWDFSDGEEEAFQHRRPFLVDLGNIDDPNPPIWIGNNNELHANGPNELYWSPTAYHGEIWDHVDPPLIRRTVGEDDVLDPIARAHAERAYHQQKGVNERTASDGADYWTQSQDDWWGTKNDTLFNVSVPGEAPGMPRNMVTDSLHCPQCDGPMHGIKCPSCGFEKTAAAVRYALPSQLEPYLEHEGDINDEELGGEPGSYLQGMAQAGIHATEDDPIVLGVEPGDPPTASIYDGNHRLLLALEEPNTPVPYVVKWIDFSTYPGDPYSGELGWPDERRAKTATDMIPSGQIKVMPDTTPGTSWDDEGQWDTDTFLDHRMINQHLREQGQAEQYKEFLERQRRQQDASWPEIGIKEAGVGGWDEIFDAEDPFKGRRPFEDRIPWVAHEDKIYWGNVGTHHPSVENAAGIGYVPRSKKIEGVPQGGRVHGWIDVPSGQAGTFKLPDDEVSEGRKNAARQIAQRQYSEGSWQPLLKPGEYIADDGTREWHSGWEPDRDASRWCDKCNYPTDDYNRCQACGRQVTAADNVPGMPVTDSGHWAYLDGHVDFGGSHSEIVERLAQKLGYDDIKTKYLSNWVARGHCPPDHAIAVGTMKGKYPYIHGSTRDRNAVFDAVLRARDGALEDS